MAYQFKTFNGKDTDVLHSKEFLSKSFKEREKIAFDSTMRKKLSEKDALLMRGFASAVAQKNRANAYNYKKDGGKSTDNKTNKNDKKAPF